MSDENRELFKRALTEALESKIDNIAEETKDAEISPSRRYRIRMNRLFRELVGGSFLPFPEVDNLFERNSKQDRNKLQGAVTFGKTEKVRK